MQLNAQQPYCYSVPLTIMICVCCQIMTSRLKCFSVEQNNKNTADMMLPQANCVKSVYTCVVLVTRRSSVSMLLDFATKPMDKTVYHSIWIIIITNTLCTMLHISYILNSASVMALVRNIPTNTLMYINNNNNSYLYSASPNKAQSVLQK